LLADGGLAALAGSAAGVRVRTGQETAKTRQNRFRQRYDVILDIAGNRSVSHLRRALGPRGTLVIVGGEGGGRWFGGIDRQLRASMLSLFVRQKLGTFVAKANGKDLVVLKELIEAGKVTPVVDKAYPLSQVPEAIRHLEEGHARGKVAITV
jgi:NADPH:quinone reductase-like Zn-dependent oxidoreductase